MTGRPCKPDADFTRLWQWLLPDTPVPVCGTGGDAANTPNEPATTGCPRRLRPLTRRPPAVATADGRGIGALAPGPFAIAYSGPI